MKYTVTQELVVPDCIFDDQEAAIRIRGSQGLGNWAISAFPGELDRSEEEPKHRIGLIIIAGAENSDPLTQDQAADIAQEWVRSTLRGTPLTIVRWQNLNKWVNPRTRNQLLALLGVKRQV